MSSPFSFEHLAGIRHDAQRMVERTRAHEGDLNELVETAEAVAHQAAAVLGALARAETDVGELHQLCSAQVRRSIENAEATVRACISAREQHVTARRLYTTIDDRSTPPHALAASRTAAGQGLSCGRP
jgi:hypothetical protein